MTLKLLNRIRPLLLKTQQYWNSRFNPLSSPFTSVPSVLLASGIITGLVLGVRQLRVLQSIELAAFDRMVRLLPDKGLDNRLLIVEITESDIESQNLWPISDRIIAELLAKIQQNQPKVIGLDLYRNLASSPGHQGLLTQLQADNVIAITELNVVSPPPEVPKERIGFNDLLIDDDNVVRRHMMYVEWPDGSQAYRSFALQLGLHYLEDRNLPIAIAPESLTIGKTEFLRLKPNSGGYQMEKSEASQWQTLIAYRSKDVAKKVTLTQVLNGEIKSEWVKDKIVLIGTTANSGKDLYFTPRIGAHGKHNLTPGVVIHAQMVSQILSAVLETQPLFWFWEEWGEFVWIWGWGLLGGILGWRCNRPLLLGLVLAIAVGGLWGISFLVFTQMGWIPIVPSALAMVFTAGSVLGYKALYSVSYDTLTGLPNRRLFIKQLKQLKNGKLPLIAVLSLDLDRFKMINDGLGNQAGDLLLIATAMRIQDCLHPQAQLARVGGDEFAILLPLQDLNEATQLAEKLQTEMNQPFLLNDRYIFTNLSIGIASNLTEQNIQLEDLLQNAQIAMYKAKLSGKFRHQVFATEMQTQAAERLQLENDLRMAVENQEFILHYQPIVCLKTGKISGFEALVRWQSSQHGFVSPVKFIPLAEETGLIIPLGKWILQEACRQMHLWHAKFPQNPPLTLGVNLSSRQFSQPDLLEQIEKTILQIGLIPECLKLELTESMVMDNVEDAIALLLNLKKMNLRLSIDDFGTGYSSLNYLYRFPVDTLKVDRSFVSRMDQSKDNAEIVRTIISLGHNLGMDVVAEGIETEAQKKAIQALDCEYAQGYFFSKPLPPESAEALLAQNPCW